MRERPAGFAGWVITFWKEVSLTFNIILSELGIKVGIYPAKHVDFLMHHKFVIFDGEAVMTGSLNWTMDVRCQY